MSTMNVDNKEWKWAQIKFGLKNPASKLREILREAREEDIKNSKVEPVKTPPIESVKVPPVKSSSPLLWERAIEYLAILEANEEYFDKRLSKGVCEAEAFLERVIENRWTEIPKKPESLQTKWDILCQTVSLYKREKSRRGA